MINKSKKQACTKRIIDEAQEIAMKEMTSTLKFDKNPNYNNEREEILNLYSMRLTQSSTIDRSRELIDSLLDDLSKISSIIKKQ